METASLLIVVVKMEGNTHKNGRVAEKGWLLLSKGQANVAPWTFLVVIRPGDIGTMARVECRANGELSNLKRGADSTLPCYKKVMCHLLRLNNGTRNAPWPFRFGFFRVGVNSSLPR